MAGGQAQAGVLEGAGPIRHQPVLKDDEAREETTRSSSRPQAMELLRMGGQ